MEHRWQELIDATVVESPYFRMFEFKVRRCPWDKPHDWTQCPFAHPTEKAKRRDPTKYKYNGTACADFRKNGFCRRGDACPFAHGVFEAWLHPARFRTKMCTDAGRCTRHVCFFAHSTAELRDPTPENLHIIQELKETLEAALRHQPTYAAQLDRLHSSLQDASEVQKVRVAVQRQQSGASQVLELLQFANSLGLLGVRPMPDLDGATTNALLGLLLQHLQPRSAMVPGLVGLDGLPVANGVTAAVPLQGLQVTNPFLNACQDMDLNGINGHVDANNLAPTALLTNGSLALPALGNTAVLSAQNNQDLDKVTLPQDWLAGTANALIAQQLVAQQRLLSQPSGASAGAPAELSIPLQALPACQPELPQLTEAPAPNGTIEAALLPLLKNALPDNAPLLTQAAAPEQSLASLPGSEFPAIALPTLSLAIPSSATATTVVPPLQASQPVPVPRGLSASAAAFVSKQNDGARSWLEKTAAAARAVQDGLSRDSSTNTSGESLTVMSPTPKSHFQAPIGHGRRQATEPKTPVQVGAMPTGITLPNVTQLTVAASQVLSGHIRPEAKPATDADTICRNQSVDKMFSDLPRDIFELK